MASNWFQKLFGRSTAQEEIKAVVDDPPPTQEQVVEQAEDAYRDRVFAKMLRGLPKPTYRCGGHKSHRPADFTIVEWRTEGTKTGDDWWCDECEMPIRNDTPLLQVSANGTPRCAKCSMPVIEAGQRRPVVVKVRPCLRCGVVYWDRMAV